MKKYLLLMVSEDGVQSMKTYDDYEHAVDGYNICTVSLGWYGELYAYDNGAYDRIQ